MRKPTELTTCRRVRALMSGHVDGVLAAGDARFVEEHLAACAACAAEKEAAARMMSGLDLIRIDAEPSERVVELLKSEARNAIAARRGQKASGRDRMMRYVAAASTVLFLSVSWMFFQKMSHVKEQRMAQQRKIQSTQTTKPGKPHVKKGTVRVAERPVSIEKAASANNRLALNSIDARTDSIREKMETISSETETTDYTSQGWDDIDSDISAMKETAKELAWKVENM